MTKNDYDNLKLSRLRESRNLTQEAVGKSIGVSRFTVIRAEQGQSASWDLLQNLSSFYQISIFELLKETKVST